MLFVVPSVLVVVGGAQPMRRASMVSFRLYRHVLVDVLAVVNVLAVEVVLLVHETGLHRQESRLVLVALVVPALRVAVPWSLLLVLGVAVPSSLSPALGVPEP